MVSEPQYEMPGVKPRGRGMRDFARALFQKIYSKEEEEELRKELGETEGKGGQGEAASAG